MCVASILIYNIFEQAKDINLYTHNRKYFLYVLCIHDAALSYWGELVFDRHISLTIESL